MFDFGVFLGNALSTMYPNTFMLAFMCVAMVATLLILIRSPAPFTIMACFMVFALIAGGSILGGVTSGGFAIISSAFLPLLILTVVIIGGAIAYAFWRMFGY